MPTVNVSTNAVNSRNYTLSDLVHQYAAPNYAKSFCARKSSQCVVPPLATRWVTIRDTRSGIKDRRNFKLHELNDTIYIYIKSISESLQGFKEEKRRWWGRSAKRQQHSTYHLPHNGLHTKYVASYMIYNWNIYNQSTTPQKMKKLINENNKSPHFKPRRPLPYSDVTHESPERKTGTKIRPSRQ